MMRCMHIATVATHPSRNEIIPFLYNLLAPVVLENFGHGDRRVLESSADFFPCMFLFLFMSSDSSQRMLFWLAFHRLSLAINHNTSQLLHRPQPIPGLAYCIISFNSTGVVTCDILNQFVTSSTPKNERDKDKKFVGPSYCFQMIKGSQRSVPDHFRTNFDFCTL
jgi:hypothetical protein